MIEILFRGKRTDNGAWETGSLVVIRGDTSEERIYIAEKMTGYHTPVTPETIGQYTGLTDKNGKRIFEGDILKVKRHLYEVVWTDGCLYAAQRNYLKGNVTRYCLISGLCEQGAEVIGNIHDNPELLEVTE